MVVLAAAGVLLATGTLELGGDEASEGEALQARLLNPFDQEMEQRNAFFSLESDYLAAKDDVQTELRSYERKFRAAKDETKQIDDEFADEYDACVQDFDTPCPDPVYPDFPDAPKIGAAVTEIRDVNQRLDRVSVELVELSPPTELEALHSRLTEAVNSLQEEALFNADAFDQAVKQHTFEDSQLSALNDSRLRTVREDTALPIIKSMNAEAVELIELMELDPDDYDVPGGDDRDQDDHSTT